MSNTIKRATLRTAGTYISTRQDFNANNSLTGTSSAWSGGPGRLSDVERDNYYHAVPDMDFIVFSYATPIAWHTPKGWHVVAEKFSVTTSKHQNIMRGAVR